MGWAGPDGLIPAGGEALSVETEGTEPIGDGGAGEGGEGAEGVDTEPLEGVDETLSGTVTRPKALREDGDGVGGEKVAEVMGSDDWGAGGAALAGAGGGGIGGEACGGGSDAARDSDAASGGLEGAGDGAMDAAEPIDAKESFAGAGRLDSGTGFLEPAKSGFPEISGAPRIRRNENQVRTARKRLTEPHLGADAASLCGTGNFTDELLGPRLRSESCWLEQDLARPLTGCKEREAGGEGATYEHRTHVRTLETSRQGKLQHGGGADLHRSSGEQLARHAASSLR